MHIFLPYRMTTFQWLASGEQYVHIIVITMVCALNMCAMHQLCPHIEAGWHTNERSCGITKTLSHAIQRHKLALLLTRYCSRARWFISESPLPEPIHEKLYQVGDYQDVAEVKGHLVDIFILWSEFTDVNLQLNSDCVSMLPQRKITTAWYDVTCWFDDQP